MGRDPELFPVDPWGRLSGFDNVIVADGSVLPGAPGVNPQATIMALAYRATDNYLAARALGRDFGGRHDHRDSGAAAHPAVGEERLRSRAVVFRFRDLQDGRRHARLHRLHRVLPGVERGLYLQRLARHRGRPAACQEGVAPAALRPGASAAGTHDHGRPARCWQPRSSVLPHLPKGFAVTVAVYLAINLGYSLGIKHVSVVELFFVASGFVIRLIGGAFALQIELSPWIIIATGMLALLMATGKRRGDIAQDNDVGTKRKSLAGYNLAFSIRR